MEPIKITKEDLNLFVITGKHFVNYAEKSKLWYAVEKILKVAIKKLKKVESQKDEKRREFAKTKEKGYFDLTEKGSYQYDKDGMAKLLTALEAIDEEEVEIPTHIVTDYNEKDLSFDIRRSFEGIVIPVIDVDIDSWEPPKKEEPTKTE